MLGAIYARESSKGENAPPLDEQIARLKQVAGSPPATFWTEFNPHANTLFDTSKLEIPDALVFSDLAITGTTDQRPGYQAMLEAAQAQRFRVVLVSARDRLMRETEFMLRLIRTMKKLGIKVWDDNEGKFIQDTTRTDRMENVLKAYMAEDFARATGDKVKRVYELKAQAAAQNNQRVAWANAYPIEHIQQAIVLRKQGYTTREIADRLPTYNKVKYDGQGNIIRTWQLKPKKSWVALMLKAQGLAGASATRPANSLPP
jgi:DNA invertase Pin-like site-specific DNA recombinase